MEAPRLSRPRAFTLLELLVTIVLVAAVLSIGFYAYHQIIPRARSAACQSHLRELGTALQLYLSEHNDTMPSLAAGRSSLEERDKPTLDVVLLPYLGSPDVLRCPADREGIFAETGTSYFWNSALNGQRASSLRFLLTRDETRIPVISDKEAFHEGVGTGVNVLYADGRVEKEFQFQVGP